MFYALHLLWIPLTLIIAAILGLVAVTVRALLEVFHD